MSRQRIHLGRTVYVLSEDFPQRLVRFKGETNLPWAEIARGSPQMRKEGNLDKDLIAIGDALPHLSVSNHARRIGDSKADKVTGLMVTPYGSDSIYAAWGQPGSGGDPTEYLVQARNVGGGTIHRQWVDSGTLGHLFERLDAGETYRVRVRAANSEGRDPVCVKVVTLPAE